MPATARNFDDLRGKVAVLTGGTGVIGGALALVMIAVRGQFSRNMTNTRAILLDLFGQGVGTAADKAAQRKPTMHLLPYGIPLCMGFISYLLLLHGI